MTPGRVSIITAVYNAAPTLEECLLSVRSQSYRDVEHIVIDGGSTDGSVEILQRHSSLLAYWVSEPDSGVFDAWNKGLSMATGEWIAFLGAEDVFTPRCVVEISYCLWGNRRAVRFFSCSLYPSWPARQNYRKTLELAGIPTQNDHSTCR